MEKVTNMEEGKIMEFTLRDFNKNMREAFSILHELYKNVLVTDPNWHFFYEGDFTLLRCGGGYINSVRVHLTKHEIDFNWKEWKEPWDFTSEMQDCFGPLFHILSVLVMELFERKDFTIGGDQIIKMAADRVIHPFLNMATYLKYFQTGRGDGSPFVKWEAEMMVGLTVDRAYIGGMISGEQRMKKIYERRGREDEKKKIDKEGEG